MGSAEPKGRCCCCYVCAYEIRTSVQVISSDAIRMAVGLNMSQTGSLLRTLSEFEVYR